MNMKEINTRTTNSSKTNTTKMKVCAFNGSPAGNNSASFRMIDAFLRGAKDAGAEVSCYNLGDYKVEQCKGCFSCWFRSPGECIMKDEMAQLMQAYREADYVIFASPVFSWNMTALLKNFIDRLVPLKSPLMTENDGNYDMADKEKREQRYIVMSNCGLPGENNFRIIREAFSICNPSLEIYRNCGKLLVSKQEIVQGIVNEYLTVLERAGFEMIENGQVSDDCKKMLEGPLMSTEEYIKFLGM